MLKPVSEANERAVYQSMADGCRGALQVPGARSPALPGLCAGLRGDCTQAGRAPFFRSGGPWSAICWTPRRGQLAAPYVLTLLPACKRWGQPGDVDAVRGECERPLAAIGLFCPTLILLPYNTPDSVCACAQGYAGSIEADLRAARAAPPGSRLAMAVQVGPLGAVGKAREQARA